VYFEGTNLLLKIDGTDKEEQEAVLFSAHYDSVSTAPGATDDGMGVTTLLQLVEYFASNRMQRTAIFNINNGEEDWLNGAHAYVIYSSWELVLNFDLDSGSTRGRM
jgi:Zn-dependent M28 family amino/carboxypeptidase